MEKIIKTVLVQVQNELFEVVFFNSYEIRFRRCSLRLDCMMEPIDEYCRVPTNHRVALTLFRKIIRIVLDHIAVEKPPYIFFSAGFDEGRMRLYKFLSKKLGERGYIYTEVPGMDNMFYSYRTPS